MDNQYQQKPSFFSRIMNSIKSIPARVSSLFNKRDKEESYTYMPSDFAPPQDYNPYNEYQANPYAQPMQEMQEPLTMAKAREMSRNAGRRRQSDNMDGAEPVYGYQPQETNDSAINNMQPMFNQPGDNPYQNMPYPQMSYPTMQQYSDNQFAPTMQAQYPTMQNNAMQEQYPTMQGNSAMGFSIERNPLLDTNIAVFMLLKPEDCHDMLRGIVNPSLYIINMENMIDDSSVSYCKHVLMGAKLVLNYAIHRISSKNIYILCPKQINIKMDEVARNLIARFDREPRGYHSESINREMNKRQEFMY